MPESPPQDNDPDRELLVAYLDGELSVDQARAVEQRLGNDDLLREEMQSLDRVWNALEELPQADLDERFSKTTIELATLEAQEEVTQLTTALPVSRRRKRLGVLLMATTAALMGFMIVRMAATSEERKIVRDLPVVWQIEALSQKTDPAFLTILLQQLPELINDYSGDAVTQRASEWHAIEQESLRERTQRVAALPSDEKLRLLSGSRQFALMPKEKQQELRERLAAISISQEPAAQDLRRAALAYAEWVGSQTPIVQTELRTTETDKDRVDRITRLYRRQHAASSRSLTKQEAANLREAVRQAARHPSVQELKTTLKEHWASLRVEAETKDPKNGFDAMASRMRSRLSKAVEEHPPLLVWLLSRSTNQRDRGSWYLFGRHRDTAIEAWNDIESGLLDALSPQTGVTFADQPEDRRAGRLGRLIMEAMAAAIEAEDMNEFFAGPLLSDNERNELLALPVDQMNERLRRYYVERELGGIDPALLRRFTPGMRGQGRGSRLNRPRESRGP